MAADSIGRMSATIDLDNRLFMTGIDQSRAKLNAMGTTAKKVSTEFKSLTGAMGFNAGGIAKLLLGGTAFAAFHSLTGQLRELADIQKKMGDEAARSKAIEFGIPPNQIDTLTRAARAIDDLSRAWNTLKLNVVAAISPELMDIVEKVTGLADWMSGGAPKPYKFTATERDQQTRALIPQHVDWQQEMNSAAREVELLSKDPNALKPPGFFEGFFETPFSRLENAKQRQNAARERVRSIEDRLLELGEDESRFRMHHRAPEPAAAPEKVPSGTNQLIRPGEEDVVPVIKEIASIARLFRSELLASRRTSDTGIRII